MANTKKPRYLHYETPIMCGNCRLETRIRVPVGVGINRVSCPKCELRELHHPSFFGIVVTPNRQRKSDREDN